MAAKFYVLSFDPEIDLGSRNGIEAAVVVAESAADAKDALKALYEDDLDINWNNAIATEIAAGANMLGWSLRATVYNAAGVLKADVTVTGSGTDDTVDEIAALAVTALNASGNISHAAYNSSTQVLSVAGAADNFGDGTVYAAFYAPGSKVPIPGFVTAKSDAGSAGAALTVTLAADAYSIPALTAKFKQPF